MRSLLKIKINNRYPAAGHKAVFSIAHVMDFREEKTENSRKIHKYDECNVWEVRQ